jgi:hypothetical protein
MTILVLYNVFRYSVLELNMSKQDLLALLSCVRVAIGTKSEVAGQIRTPG